MKARHPDDVRGRDVWLVHPWNLGTLPAELPEGTLVLGIFVADFHRTWPWSESRWRFVATRMAELTPLRWWASAQTIGDALSGARTVRSFSDPHLDAWLKNWAQCHAKPALFPQVDTRCDSFSKWWARALRGFESAADLLAANEVPAC